MSPVNDPRPGRGWGASRRGRWGRRKRSALDEGSVWPSASQVLLLNAGLSRGREAVEAWEQWLALADLDAVDPSSSRILPLVYRNLAREAVGVASMDTLKRHYMVAWGKNQRLFRLVSQTVGHLSAGGIETLLLKGAALVPLYYGDDGSRGMGDFDVLVPEARFHDACSLLREAGWRPLHFDPEYFDTRFEHAIAFLDDAGNSIDLHCHVLIESCERGADDAFWEASKPLEVRGTQTRTLCHTDHFLQACAHGLTWVKFPPVRWVADAMTILRKDRNSIEWERLVEQAAERGVAFKILASVDYLRSAFGADIPLDVGRSLRQARATRADRRAYETWTQNKRGRPASLVRYHWSMYRRGVRSEGALERVTTIPRYLRFWAQTDRLWVMPATLAVKAWRVVGHRLGFYQYWDGT